MQQRKKSWITIAWHAATEMYEIRFRARAGKLDRVVADLKGITPRHRTYDAGGRTWSVAPDALDEAVALAVRHFDDATLVEGNRYRNLHSGETVEQLVLFE
jgi:hypothetical protein